MKRLLPLLVTALLVSCGQEPAPVDTTTETEAATEAPTYEILVDRFADVEVLRYEVPGFDELSLKQKKLVYYLSQAALVGRDILYDQNYEHNLRIRKLLAAVVGSYSGDRGGEPYQKLLDYAKRVWYAHGIHHPASNDKMLPGFTSQDLANLVSMSDASELPLDDGQTVDELLALLDGPIFDPDVASKKVTLGIEYGSIQQRKEFRTAKIVST